MTWKIQMCVGDEAEKKEEDPRPVPTLKLLLQTECKEDQGKAEQRGLLVGTVKSALQRRLRGPGERA